ATNDAADRMPSPTTITRRPPLRRVLSPPLMKVSAHTVGPKGTPALPHDVCRETVRSKKSTRRWTRSGFGTLALPVVRARRSGKEGLGEPSEAIEGGAKRLLGRASRGCPWLRSHLILAVDGGPDGLETEAHVGIVRIGLDVQASQVFNGLPQVDGPCLEVVDDPEHPLPHLSLVVVHDHTLPAGRRGALHR